MIPADAQQAGNPFGYAYIVTQWLLGDGPKQPDPDPSPYWSAWKLRFLQMAPSIAGPPGSPAWQVTGTWERERRDPTARPFLRELAREIIDAPIFDPKIDLAEGIAPASGSPYTG